MNGIAEILDLLMFGALIVGLLCGFPVAFTLGGVALIFALIGLWLGAFQPGFLAAFPQRIYGGVMTNSSLISLPLFVFMGVVLEQSRIAENLLTTAGRLARGVPGGLGFAVTLIGALLAASTGIVGATVITMALIALPSMLRAGYSPRLASGSIAAAATLCQIIPPSVVLILLGDVMATANQEARLTTGKGPDSIAVSDLFAGAILPGLGLVVLFLLYQWLVAVFNPKSCPALPRDPDDPVRLQEITRAFFAPIGLIVAVLGSILGGLATPTEAAAVGAVGALMLASLRVGRDASASPAPTAPKDRQTKRLRPLIFAGFWGLILAFTLRLFFDLRLGGSARDLWQNAAVFGAAGGACLAILGFLSASLMLYRDSQLRPAMRSTAEIAAMVFSILIGAALFSIVFRGLGGDETVASWLKAVPGDLFGALILVNVVLFVLGFFLDFIEITFVVVPIVAPALIIMGADPIWLGVLLAMNLQTSFLTPPFGFALFYLRGAAPPSVQTLDIYRGAIPYIGLQLMGLALVWAFPVLTTFLPKLLR